MAISTIAIISILTLALSWLQGKVSRMAGGGAPKLPYGLDQWIYALPYGVAGLIASMHLEQVVDVFGYFDIHAMYVCGLISYGLAFLGKRLGHGQYFDLATYPFRVVAEKIDFLVRLVFGKDPNTQSDNTPGDRDRDLFGLSLTGLVVGLGLAGVMYYVGSSIWATAILITTAAKGPLYLLSLKQNSIVRKVLGKIGISFDDDRGHTEPGEWLTGIVGGLGVWSFILISINMKYNLVNQLLNILGV